MVSYYTPEDPADLLSYPSYEEIQSLPPATPQNAVTSPISSVSPLSVSPPSFGPDPGAKPGVEPGELYNWEDITAYDRGVPTSPSWGDRVADVAIPGVVSAVTGLPSSVAHAAYDFTQTPAGNRFSPGNLVATAAKVGAGLLAGPFGLAAAGLASQLDPVGQETRDANLGYTNPSLLGGLFRSVFPSWMQENLFYNFSPETKGKQDIDVPYEQIEGVKGTNWNSWETSLDDDVEEGDVSYDSTTSSPGLDALDATDAEQGASSASGNEAETEDDYDDYDDDQFANGGLAQNFAEPKDTLNLGLASFKASEGAPGVTGSNFNFRTPDGGIPLGDALTLTGNYGRSTEEVTPGAMGIPQEVIDRFRLQNQKQKSTSYNVGIRAMFPDGVVPDFMDRILRPKSANVSYGQSGSTFQNVQGDTFTNSDRGRGIGGQGQVLRGMFGNSAPTVRVQYTEPNKNDKSYSGSMNIPMGRGNLSLYGSRGINEGRPNDTTFGVQGKVNF